MAIIDALASAQIVDADGEVTSHEQPFKFDNTVATIANLISWVQGWAVSLDAVTDGQITKLRLALLIPLPSGLKTAAAANSDNEKTGLFTMNVTGSPNRYGVDVPAFAAALFVGNSIPITGAVLTYMNYITGTVTGITPSDRYANPLLGAERARKTFRKHRRALSRA